MEHELPAYPIIDGHVDVIYRLMDGEKNISFHELSEGPVTLDKLEAGKIRVFAAALYCPDTQNGPDWSLDYLKRLLAFTETGLKPLKHIETAQDLEACYTHGRETGFLLLLENADALVDGSLDELHKKAVKVIGLTHVGRNRIGDGNGVSYPERLSTEGRRLVSKLDTDGFAIDIAHLSRPCFRDVLDLFRGPLISSHTGFRFFCDRARNLDKDQLRAIFERQGMVGIAADPAMLSTYGTASIEDVFKHIDWVVQKHGPRYVGLGSDFCGFAGINEGLEDISKLHDLTRHFHDHGYPPEAITDILGGNWYRFYSSLLQTR
jgi:membrane dipeptidase